MCGIVGIIGQNEREIDLSISRMNRKIIHRGPDSEGYFKSKDGKVAMAMRRLAIIDLETGGQPITSKDGARSIVFNGAIYNHQDLRRALLADGAEFFTSSDTEVILRLYERDGIDGICELDGMFAFSIYDQSLGKIFIARDFFGEKPLYYTLLDGKFCWASELKALTSLTDLKPPIDKQGLNLYFQLSYIPAPFTIFEGIFKLEANHYLVYDLSTSQFRCYEVNQRIHQFPLLSKREAIIETESQLRQSILSRSVCDVPIGTFLSGGVDSSIVSLCMAQNTTTPIDTFSIGFDKKSFDETAKARTVAKMIGSHHHEFIVTEKDFLHDLSAIILNFDEPFADSSALPSYWVAKKAREHVKVVLTGDGGDEMFGGYNKYYMGKINARYTHIVPKSLHNFIYQSLHASLSSKDDSRGGLFQLSRLLSAINYEGDAYLNIISLGFQSKELHSLFLPSLRMDNPIQEYKKKSGGKQKTLLDFKNIDRLLSLEGDLLVKVDRTSMLNSLECRSPFLSKKIWDFTAQLPDSYLINGWDKKHILKASFEHYFPKGFLHQPKQGFSVPVGDWLRQSLSSELRHYASQSFVEKQQIFQYHYIHALVTKHLNGIQDNTLRVWTYYCFQKWFENEYDVSCK